MKNKMLVVLSMTVALLVISAPMYAHHSVAVHDLSRILTMKATVTKFEFINPHVLLHFDVKAADGSIENWVANTGHVGRETELGMTKNTFKPGEEITISGNPYKDGRKILSALKIVRANGEEVKLETTSKQAYYEKKTGTNLHKEADKEAAKGANY